MPATDFFNHPTERFLCPVETCCRTFKSKTPWTRHLRTAHANLNLHHHEHTIVNLWDVSLFPIQGNRDLRSSSPGVLPVDHSPVQSNVDADDFQVPYHLQVVPNLQTIVPFQIWICNLSPSHLMVLIATRRTIIRLLVVTSICFFFGVFITNWL